MLSCCGVQRDAETQMDSDADAVEVHTSMPQQQSQQGQSAGAKPPKPRKKRRSLKFEEQDAQTEVRDLSVVSQNDSCAASCCLSEGCVLR
jgi:hypothetical protein